MRGSPHHIVAMSSSPSFFSPVTVAAQCRRVHPLAFSFACILDAPLYQRTDIEAPHLLSSYYADERVLLRILKPASWLRQPGHRACSLHGLDSLRSLDPADADAPTHYSCVPRSRLFRGVGREERRALEARWAMRGRLTTLFSLATMRSYLADLVDVLLSAPARREAPFDAWWSFQRTRARLRNMDAGGLGLALEWLYTFSDCDLLRQDASVSELWAGLWSRPTARDRVAELADNWTRGALWLTDGASQVEAREDGVLYFRQWHSAAA